MPKFSASPKWKLRCPLTKVDLETGKNRIRHSGKMELLARKHLLLALLMFGPAFGAVPDDFFGQQKSSTRPSTSSSSTTTTTPNRETPAAPRPLPDGEADVSGKGGHGGGRGGGGEDHVGEDVTDANPTQEAGAVDRHESDIITDSTRWVCPNAEGFCSNVDYLKANT